MHSLKTKEVDPFSIKQILKSKFFREKQKLRHEFNYIAPSENHAIEKEKFSLTLSKIDLSVDQMNIESTVDSLGDLFYLFIYQKQLSQEFIDIIKASNFLQSIYKCISTLGIPEVLSFICLLLIHLTYSSNDLIEEMFRSGILEILMNIFINSDGQVSPNFLFALFGNACFFDHISSFFQLGLFTQIQKYLLHSSIYTQTNCLYCLFVLTMHSPIPSDLVFTFFINFNTIFFKTAHLFDLLNQQNNLRYKNEVNDNFETDEEYEYESTDLNEELYQIIKNEGFYLDNNDNDLLSSVKKQHNKMLYYIVAILDKYSSDKEGCYFIVQANIPSLLLSCINYFPIIIQQKFLIIIQNTLKIIPNEEAMLPFIKSLDINILMNILDSDNDSLISIVYDIFSIIGFYDKTFIQKCITKDMLKETIEMIDFVNFYSKVSIMNFLAMMLLNSNQTELLNEIVTEPVVEEFIEIAEQNKNFVKNSIGAISKLFLLTFDQPELHEMLEPFVVDSL